MNEAGWRPQNTPRQAADPRRLSRAHGRFLEVPGALGRRLWRWWGVRLASAGLLAAACAACGASIQAVYEGDVQFEHCMALDAQPDVKPAIRRACWQEWVGFYTYGQTRDRVRHAQRRAAQLSSGNGAFSAVTGVDPLQAPEPTSALLGPPGTTIDLSDAGASAQRPAGEAPASRTQQRCTQECDAIRDDCRRECRTHGCHKGCAFRHRGCLSECGP